MPDGLLQTFPGTFNTGKFLPPVSTNPLALQPGAMLYVDPMDPADPWGAGAASSLIVPFSAQPANVSTLTLGGVPVTFGSDVAIGANLAATLTTLAAVLNASVNATIALCTYAASATALTITYKTAGILGDAFTVAASGTSNATVPIGHLVGGGTPSNGSTIKNLACWRFAEMANNPGLGRYTDYQLSFTDKHTTSSELLLERTAKGGLHGLPSQVNNGTADRGAYAQLPAAHRQWVYDNPGHNYFFGVIGRKTRDRAGTTNFPRSGILRLGGNNSKYRYLQDYGSMKSSVPGNTNGGAASYTDTSGNALSGTATSVFVGTAESTAWDSTLPTSASDMLAAPMIFGNGLDNSNILNQVHGWVMYALYMEDLTFSGRTYATAKAQLLAQAAADFGVGGRYAGDTFTAPAGFP
jgi:hypothetical protein